MKISNKQAVGVKIENLTKKFPTNDNDVFTAVNQVNLDIKPGELVTFLGPSGCGKTTTLRMIAGFEYPTEGEIKIGDEDISQIPANKRDVGMVFQNYALFPHLSVRENVAYGLDIRGVGQDEKNHRVNDVLETMQIKNLADRQPQQLSGGQQQRVSLARTLVIEPRVLLFDEPLSNLDAKLREYMRQEIREIQQSLGITSIYVTHDQAEAMAISDRVVIMDKGQVQQFDTPLNIYLYPQNHFVANFMGKADFIKSKIEKIDGDQISLKLLGNEVIANTNQSNWTLNQEVDLVLRPEFWQINSQGKFQAIVKSSSYLGEYMEYQVALGTSLITINDYNQFRYKRYTKGETINFDLIQKPSILAL